MIVEGEGGRESASFLPSLPSFSSPGLSKRITPIIFGGRTDGRAFFAQLARSFVVFPHRNFDRQLRSSIRKAYTSGQIGFAGQGSVGRARGREGEGSIGPPALPPEIPKLDYAVRPDIGRVEICQVIDKQNTLLLRLKCWQHQQQRGSFLSFLLYSRSYSL